jgi:hypothetical protein
MRPAPHSQAVTHQKMNRLEQEFLAIKWPKEFIVQFKDGTERMFVSDQGVFWDGGGNLDNEYENRANITCAWKKKSATQQRYRMIEFFVDDVEQFQTVSGDVIWKPIA